MVLMLFAAFVLWVLGLLLAGLAIARAAQPEPETPKPPSDPIKETVAKWMHDWERGRA